MRSILTYLRQHFVADFKWAYYLTVLGFIAVCIAVNYLTAPEGFRSWEVWIIRTLYVPGSIWCLPVYFLFYAVPYFVIALFTAFFNKDADFLKHREFWLRTLFILLAIAAQASFSPHRLAAHWLSNPSDQYFLSKILGPLNPYLMMGVPILIFWWWRDRQRGVPFMYGLVKEGFDPLPYFIILGIMVPIIGIAAMQPQFLNYYPTLRPNYLKDFSLGCPRWLAYTIYETVYGLYFIWAEIVYRGFLVVGMAGVMGRHSIAPMSGLYVFQHFAKPPGETISSVFGGYILGIISLRTNNIIGGAIIHGAIAVMMDIFALAMSYK